MTATQALMGGKLNTILSEILPVYLVDRLLYLSAVAAAVTGDKILHI